LREIQRERSSRFMMYFFGALGTATMLLQAYNVVLAGAFWPFFAGIIPTGHGDGPVCSDDPFVA
jgi:hypothetical protein